MSKTLKYLLFSLVITLAGFICIELCLRLFFNTVNLSNSENQKRLSPLYKAKEWMPPLLQECAESLRTEYEPFIGWQRKPYHGKFVNVGSDRTRKTWNPTSFEAPPKVVYVFGGSTIWGEYARDEHTIPSHLSKILNGKTNRYRVVNYGETAHTFLQEIIHLILLLRESAIPDYVIFYDGMNDLYATYQAGKVETIWYTESIRGKINKSCRRQILERADEFLELHCLIYKTLLNLFKKTITPNRSLETVPQLAKEFASSYAQSFMLLSQLSQIYNFRFSCFWQPSIFTENTFLNTENTILQSPDREFLIKLYTETRRAINNQSLEHFHDISSALTDRKEPCYFDYCHLTESCNEIIAKKISATMQQELTKNPVASPT